MMLDSTKGMSAPDEDGSSTHDVGAASHEAEANRLLRALPRDE